MSRVHWQGYHEALLVRSTDLWRVDAWADASITAAACWKCGRPNPDLAHHLYEFVAALLSERVRRALDHHFDTCSRCIPGGDFTIDWCASAFQLWTLLPRADQIPPN